MAKVYISEFAKMEGALATPSPIAAAPAIAEQTVAIGGADAGSNPFNAATNFIRVHTDAICSIAIDKAATANTARMAANTTEYFGVNPGSTLHVITNS